MMKPGTLMFLLLPLIVFQCNGQGKQAARIETIKNFVNDLRNGKSNPEIFTKYLASQGKFTNDTVRSAADGFTDLLRGSIQSTKSKDVQVYLYSTQPEKAELLKDINDPAGGVEHVALEFTLDTRNHKSGAVDMNDLYVLKLPDERIFVLFDHENKMITWFGMQWGQKISLMEF